MFLSRLELSSLPVIVGVVIVSGLAGGLGMFLYQTAVSWRLRRFVRKNCAGCMTPDTDALVTHSHPITSQNRNEA